MGILSNILQIDCSFSIHLRSVATRSGQPLFGGNLLVGAYLQSCTFSGNPVRANMVVQTERVLVELPSHFTGVRQCTES